MTREFVAPEFMENSSPEEIQRRMMKNLPEDIDNMPGGFAYDFTMPTALEKSNLIQFHIMRTIMLMFPMWAWGQWLDLHGRQVGVTRKEANRASGSVTVEGLPGTRLESGFSVCTPAAGNSPSIEFVLDRETVIPENGVVTAGVTASAPGASSNVKVNTITLMSRPVKGIARIYNQEDITGGTDPEGDEEYLDRIMEKYGAEGDSNIGNDADYKRWAKEVSGIGDCIVIPAWNGPGTVKLVLVDANGQPANEQLLGAVYDHIVSPQDREKRLMPTGSAQLTVAAADTRILDYSCKGLVLSDGVSAQQAADRFRQRVLEYYTQAKADNLIRYNKIHCILTGVEGVLDFTELLVNGADVNVALDQDEYPETGQITFES